MMICPDCKKPMFRIGAKIEGMWACLWLCDCQPDKMQIEKWDKTYNDLLKKFGDGLAKEKARDWHWITREAK